MKKPMVILLVAAVLVAAALVIDQSRVTVARGALQNQVNMLAGETRQEVGSTALLTMILTHPRGTRTLDLTVPTPELTGVRLAGMVPMDSLLTRVELRRVELTSPESREEPLTSPEFRDGSAVVEVTATGESTTVTVTATATAGYLGRSISATAQETVLRSDVQQEVQASLTAAVQEAARQVAQRKTSFPVKVILEDPDQTTERVEPPEPAEPSEAADPVTEPDPAAPATPDPVIEPTPATPTTPASGPIQDPNLKPGEPAGYGREATADEIREAIRRAAEEEREELERQLREEGVLQ